MSATVLEPLSLRADRTGATRWPRLRRAVRLLGPQGRAVSLILSLAVAGVAFNVYEPLLLKAFFDRLGAGKSASLILETGLALLTLEVLRQATTALSNWLTWKTRLAVHHRLLDQTVGKLHRLPASFHQTEGVGGVMTRLDRGIQGLLGAFQETAFNVLPSVVYLAISIVVMVRLEPTLALVSLAFAPLPALIAAWAAPEQVQREKTLLERWSRIYSRFREVLSGIVTVRSFAREEDEKERFLRDVDRANQVVERGVGIDSAVGAAQSLVAGLGRIAVIAVGGFLVSTGQTTVGTVVAFLGYLGGLFGPVRGLSGLFTTLSKASASFDVLVAILDTKDSVSDAPDAIRLEGSVRGQIAFRRVRFRYADQTAWVLDGIDLEASPGETIAVVGPSGAGKSTMMALLQRHLDPVEGSILVDGVDLRSLEQRSFRRHIGVVLQDALLFNDTVRNNISYGCQGASLSAVIAAAEAANAHSFVSAMPDGYETILGEQGGRLSMGERQRIAIARVLLKDPRIVILDEATSALDAETERLVQDALQTLIRGRTTFVIAHRLSTVVSADRILVLRSGRIEETGTHEALLNAGGYYASLVRSQTRGLLPSTALAPAALPVG